MAEFRFIRQESPQRVYISYIEEGEGLMSAFWVEKFQIVLQPHAWMYYGQNQFDDIDEMLTIDKLGIFEKENCIKCIFKNKSEEIVRNT